MDFLPLYSSSLGNLYRVTDGQTPLLIECGVPIQAIKKALGYRLSEVAGCLVSHSHMDHSRAVKGLLRIGIDCYMSAETADTLGVKGHRLHILQPLRQFNMGTWRVLPFSTQHDCPGSMGFLLALRGEKLLFATDTYYIKYRFSSLSHIAIECNYSLDTLSPDIGAARRRRLIESHFSLENVKKFLAANDLSGVREIHLLHMSRDHGDADRFQGEIQGLTGKPVYVAGEKP